MNDEAGLLGAIIATPDCDTARLVYADWLQDHGHDQRAEFIRVQIAIARTAPEDQCDQCYAVTTGGQRTNGPCRCAPVLRDLKRREQELWGLGDPNSWAVDDPMPSPHCIRCIDDESISRSRIAYDPIVIYRRGFPDQVTCTAADWLAHGGAIRAAHPVTRVVLTTFADWPYPTDGRHIGDGWYGFHRWPGVKFRIPLR